VYQGAFLLSCQVISALDRGVGDNADASPRRGDFLAAMSAAGSLGPVGDPVPHDRVYHLDPLPRHRLERRAVGHAPVAALAVVGAEAVVAPADRVAGEYEQVLEPLVGLPGRADRRYGRAGLPVAGREPAVAREVVGIREQRDVDGYDGLRRGPLADAGDREQALVFGKSYFSGVAV
jgi:hypothetical protein